MRPNSQDLRENGYHDALLPFVSSSLIASPPTAPAASAPVTAQPAAASTSEAPTWATQAVIMQMMAAMQQQNTFQFQLQERMFTLHPGQQ